MCISLSCALMKIRLRGFLLYPDFFFFFCIDREQCGVESIHFWDRGLHWWLVWCSCSEMLGRLNLAGHGFSMYSKTPLRCRSPSGVTSALHLLLQRTLLVHSPKGEFCQWWVRNSAVCSWAVLNACLCKCAEWCGSVLQCELKWLGKTKNAAGRKGWVCVVWVFCCFGFLLIY